MQVSGTPRRPTVGILCTQRQATSLDEGALEDYIDAVTAANGEPKLIVMSDAPPAQLLDQVDALLVPGGADVDPALYNQQRRFNSATSYPQFDRFEYNVLQHAVPTGMPILGICRGMQLMNVAAGGSLIQDINAEAQRPNDLRIEHQHKKYPSLAGSGGLPVHNIKLAPDVAGRVTALKKMFGLNFLAVNSAHHQALASIAPIYAVTAWAMDGVVEAIERQDNPAQWGVQWHPERMRKEDPTWGRVFDKLVGDAANWRGIEAPQPAEETHAAQPTAEPTPHAARAPRVRKARVEKPPDPLLAALFPGLPG